MLECQLQNASIKYKSFGEGHPIIIMHGGGPNDHQYMVGSLEPLFEQRKGWQRIYLDLPGHGKTEWPKWISSHDQVLDLLCDFIDKVIPGKKFSLVGLSWGGQLALGIIDRRVELVEGLYLNVPATNSDESKHELPKHITLVEDHSFREELQEDERWITDVLVVQDRSLLNRLRKEIFEVRRENQKQNVSRELLHSQLNYDAKQVFLNKPTLILVGRQDQLVGYQDAWDLIENFPRATFAVLDRAGHMLSLDQRVLMEALVNEWLDRVEEGRGKLTDSNDQ